MASTQAERIDSVVMTSAPLTRDLSGRHPYLREQHVGLGCALENLVLACRARGLQPTVELLPDAPDADRVALAASTPAASALYDAIGARHTNRRPYDARSISTMTLAALVDIGDLQGVDVHWVTDSTEMATLGILLVDAATAIVHDEQQSIDGFAWFRGDNDAVRRYRDGLTLDAQGVSPLVLSVAKLLPTSSRTAGDTFWVDQTRDVHTKTAATYGVLTAADADDRATQLIAGRLLQRIHLTATIRGISLQHMNQITERIDREQVGSAAVWQRRSTLGTGARATAAVGMLVSGLLCFTTVGRLWFVPGALLLVAGVATVENWRVTAAVVTRNWLRCLLSALGAVEALMAAGGTPSIMVVGAVGGAALVVAAWWRTPHRLALVALVVLGTVPLAALAWTALVPVVLLVAAAFLAAPLVFHPRSSAVRV